ncbi:MAG: hypothetical protein AMXMBFR78_29670 [Rubrivivax sp.]|jgi:hypothetical protein
MRDMLDASWRAAAYCWHPLALLWGLLPLALAAGGVLGLGWIGWEEAVAQARALLERTELLATLFDWLQAIGLPDLRPVLAPLLVVALTMPVLVLLTLLLVAWLLAPAMVALVARRRFPALAASPEAAGRGRALGWALLCALAALAALVFSMPLWLLPPLVFVLPPLVWGWLCYRVFSFCALARHASAGERRLLLHQRRWALRGAALLCGLACALPTLSWTLGATALVMAPLLMPLLLWLYTILFAFATLWFTHYLLAALQRLRQDLAAQAGLQVSSALPTSP